jgi:hypothetical protein
MFSRPVHVQPLEQRRLLSATTQQYVNHSDFPDTSDLATNGYGGANATNVGVLLLTDGGNDEARSVWYDQTVPIAYINTTFQFGVSSGPGGDGFTFTIQNDPNGTSALGSDGGAPAVGSDLGYTGIQNSVAIAFDFDSTNNYGANTGDSVMTIVQNGASPSGGSWQDLAGSGIVLNNGDTYTANITYNGTTLALTLSDTTNNDTFSTSEAINLVQVIGTTNAYVGFTGGSGADTAYQGIINWQYSAGGPEITSDASTVASPYVTTTSAGLQISATDANSESLTYDWTMLHTPSGAQTPHFSNNDDSSADSATATFSKRGTYIFQCTVTNTDGVAATSDVVVYVLQTLTSLKMSPHASIVTEGSQQTFSAGTYDQFGKLMVAQPAITFAVQQGPSDGSIDANTGVYTAGTTKGHLIIQATDSTDDLSGVVGASVSA